MEDISHLKGIDFVYQVIAHEQSLTLLELNEKYSTELLKLNISETYLNSMLKQLIQDSYIDKTHDGHYFIAPKGRGFYGYAYQHFRQKKEDRKKNIWDYFLRIIPPSLTIIFGLTTWHYQQLNAQNQSDLKTAKQNIAELIRKVQMDQQTIFS